MKKETKTIRWNMVYVGVKPNKKNNKTRRKCQRISKKSTFKWLSLQILHSLSLSIVDARILSIKNDTNRSIGALKKKETRWKVSVIKLHKLNLVCFPKTKKNWTMAIFKSNGLFCILYAHSTWRRVIHSVIRSILLYPLLIGVVRFNAKWL